MSDLPSLESLDLPVPIDRHRAAIARTTLSKPVRLAVEANVLTPDTTFFDYGCGQGGDVKRLAHKGFKSQGWDPFYQPHRPPQPADVVNLGYILNVIEDQGERRQALLKAWNLAQSVLIVAAQVLIDDRDRGWVAYEDGVITRRNTFQKYYEQEELKVYIDQVIGSLGIAVDAIPVAIGIYFVFRDPAQAQAFRASRFRSRASTPRIRQRDRRFEEHKERLAPLMTFYTERGRLPLGDEVADGVGDRDRWHQHLAAHCAKLQGHRLVWRQDADPYKLKLLKAQARQRSTKPAQ